jgi:glutathionylspermidine synthase
VNCVWKTWAWETAIEQIREVSETEYAAVPIRTGHPEGEVRLIDVLLRPEVLVFEPLWTVIPGNKAILPVLWQLFPNHRYLLDTDFEVNDLLKQTGYAVKPIAGRCGSNIDLISPRMSCWINPAASLSTVKTSTSSCGACQTLMASTFRSVPLPWAVTMAEPVCAATIAGGEERERY